MKEKQSPEGLLSHSMLLQVWNTEDIANFQDAGPPFLVLSGFS